MYKRRHKTVSVKKWKNSNNMAEKIYQMCICNGEKILNLQSYLRITVLSEFTSDTLLKTRTIDDRNKYVYD